jgi:organic radical activating enzyme
MPALDSRSLWVAETFSSLQGEGPSTGRPAAFIRLSGCHLSCGWCDTAYTWDDSRFDLAAERHMSSVEELVDWFDVQHVGLVVITGGEPLLQQDAVIAFLIDLAAELRVCRVEVETSGTITPRTELVELVSAFNVSPKLAHSGMPERRRIRPDVLRALQRTGKAVWKFVALNVDDLDEVDGVLALVSDDRESIKERVWIMPEGTDPETVLDRLRDIAGEVACRGWNLAPRLHVLLWGDDRGR